MSPQKKYLIDHMSQQIPNRHGCFPAIPLHIARAHANSAPPLVMVKVLPVISSMAGERR